MEHIGIDLGTKERQVCLFARRMAKSSAKLGGGRIRQALLADPEGVPAHLERVRGAVASLRQQIADAALEHRMLAA
jgi:hypothetical protein